VQRRHWMARLPRSFPGIECADKASDRDDHQHD
jgi:hypothetical protein